MHIVKEAPDLSYLVESCTGVSPLTARLEHWMLDLLDSNRLFSLCSEYGAPLNIQNTKPFKRNVLDLINTASKKNINFRPYFARKSNKCLSYVAAAKEIGIGLDTASYNEIKQSLDLGVSGNDIVCTAAIKSAELIDVAINNGVTLIIDNDDELELVIARSESSQKRALVGIRLGGFNHDGEVLHSRFGYPIGKAQKVIDYCRENRSRLRLVGLHFHLNGYNAEQRVSALKQCLVLAIRFNEETWKPLFIDIGGGFPMRYLDDPKQLLEWDRNHNLALMDERAAITKDNHPLGKTVVDGRIVGEVDSYPTYQTLVQERWLESILDAKLDSATIGEILSENDIELRCEPGRSVLDGCGVTVAQVQFCKHDTKGDLVVGVSMNRTQHRTGFAEFLLDPLLVKSGSVTSESIQVEGYLAGTYCTESEWISRRKFKFNRGVAAGDFVVFPNTAGYLMHFLESRSHQLELAKNVFVTDQAGHKSVSLDQIDAPLR